MNLRRAFDTNAPGTVESLEPSTRCAFPPVQADTQSESEDSQMSCGGRTQDDNGDVFTIGEVLSKGDMRKVDERMVA